MTKIVPTKLMARDISQGSGVKGGAPRSPEPTPDLSSGTAQRLKWSEECLNGVRQTGIPALNEISKANSKEIERLLRKVPKINQRGHGLNR